MEFQEAPQVVEVNNPDIPPDPHPIESETATEESFEVPDVTEVITSATVEAPGLRISTRVSYQTSTYAPIMTGKRYAYAMM